MGNSKPPLPVLMPVSSCKTRLLRLLFPSKWHHKTCQGKV